jgi:hypothetical protein
MTNRKGVRKQLGTQRKGKNKKNGNSKGKNRELLEPKPASPQPRAD